MWMFLAHAAWLLSATPRTLADACTPAPHAKGAATAQLAIGSLRPADVILDGVRLDVSTPLAGSRALEAVPGQHLVGLYSEGEHHVYSVMLAEGPNKVILLRLGDRPIEGKATYLGVAPCWDKLKKGRPAFVREPEPLEPAFSKPPEPRYAGVWKEMDKLTRAQGMDNDSRADLQSGLEELLARYLRQRAPSASPTQQAPVTEDQLARARKLLEEGNHAVLMGNYAEAVVAGEGALEADATLVEAHKLLGVAYARIEKPCVARTHYQAYLDSAAPSGSTKDRIKIILSAPEMAGCR